MTADMSGTLPVYLAGTNESVTWKVETQLFTAEASTLGWKSGAVQLKSARTGKVKVFTNPVPTLSATCPDGCCGGDVRYWTLKSSDGFELRIWSN